MLFPFEPLFAAVSIAVSRLLPLFLDAPDHRDGSRRDKIPQAFPTESVSQLLEIEDVLGTDGLAILLARTVAWGETQMVKFNNMKRKMMDTFREEIAVTLILSFILSFTWTVEVSPGSSFEIWPLSVQMGLYSGGFAIQITVTFWADLVLTLVKLCNEGTTLGNSSIELFKF